MSNYQYEISVESNNTLDNSNTTKAEAIDNAEEQEATNETTLVPVCFKKFPKNFKVLFAFPQRKCSCHGRRMTVQEIFNH